MCIRKNEIIKETKSLSLICEVIDERILFLMYYTSIVLAWRVRQIKY
jgi:hypothetical protein